MLEIVLWYWLYFLKGPCHKYPIYLKIKRYHLNYIVEIVLCLSLTVSEYPLKQNKNVKKHGSAIYTYFYNIFLNVLRVTFFSIYNLPFLCSPNISKIRVKVGPKTNYFSYILSSSTNRIAVFNNFFSLICSQPRGKQNCAHDFLLSKYFLNNLLLTVFMQNMLSLQ